MSENDSLSTLLPSRDLKEETIIENKIYSIRGKQVMLDSDVAFYFQVETKRLNQQMLRNKNRFPEEFCFKLNSNEFKNLRLQNVTFKSSTDGRKYLPYVYTEPGIVALAGVLKSKIAAEASVKIVQQFVEMRHFLASNRNLIESLANLQNRQLKFEDETNNKLEIIFKKIEHVEIPKENIFFKGQFFDAYDFLATLINNANKSLILIDPYCDGKALSFFKGKKKGVQLTIMKSSYAKLFDIDVEQFTKQYGDISVLTNDDIHDRFLIIDKQECYSLGSSLNRLGNKTIFINQIENITIFDLIMKLVR